ncbi:doublecortin domain-containing protein 1 [Emydura macquarii macquarii]|uniref:doublecortin domain-containing protein 1 n=1 Tax=Emydura macquarii macquarii TaxID=1129001 RepID=UPI00352BA18A
MKQGGTRRSYSALRASTQEVPPEKRAALSRAPLPGSARLVRTQPAGGGCFCPGASDEGTTRKRSPAWADAVSMATKKASDRPELLQRPEMANYKRPVSAHAPCNPTFGASQKNNEFLTSSTSSCHNSVQTTVMKQYVNKVITSSHLYHLPRNFISPYAKAAIKNTTGKQNSRQPLFGPNIRLQSAMVSRRSGLQDYSTHQTKSVQSCDRLSDLDSYKSNSTNNFCLISPSKRNRPVSAPTGQLRCTQFSSSRLQLAQKESEVPQVIKCQPGVIKVTAYKNGTRSISTKVAVPSIKLLLEECTEKLNLNMAARRVFLADGTEALEPKDIPHDADIYISTGEPFLDPFKKIKDHLSLMKKVTWTMNGLVLPTGVKRRKTKPVLSNRMKKLVEKSSFRILVFKNCTGQDGYEIIAAQDQIEKFLDACTVRMNLTSPAKYLYSIHGAKIEDFIGVPLLDKCLQNSITPLRGPVWVSKGEGFSPSGAKMYIQGVLLALHQRLKSSKNYCKQLDFAIDGQRGEITEKGILSMTTEELYLEQEKVNKLMEELQEAIKSYKGHLSKLAPQLQAEQEQCASYVYQHIKRLPANAVLPQGLKLTVYENGKDTGEIHVYITKREMENNCRNQPSVMMERLLHMIHQKLQHSADFRPSGLNLVPARLFDEKGQEIKNPLLLKNEQKIWFSYGRDYRSPLHHVLTLTFDRVTAAEKDGITVIYKTPLDPNADLLPGCDNWEAFTGFPDNLQCTNHQTLQNLEKIDMDSHFIQYKADPQIVFHVSVAMEKMRKALPRKKDNQDLIVPSTMWPLANMWLITKAGMILSRAMVQSCLAIGCPIRVETDDGISLEGYKLIVQKRDKSSIYQHWGFGNDGSIYCKAYPEFVLTYLEELNVREEVTQMEHHIHHGAWSTAHQEIESSSAEEVTVPSQRQALQKNVSNPNQKQLSGPLDAHLMPAGPLRETTQLTVALVRKLEEKHPKASAQRWAIKHEGTTKPDQWKHSKVENPLWNKLTYMWPVLPNGELNEDFDWPIEGLLVPNSPSLKKPSGKKSDWYMPVRLRALHNGDRDKSRAITIVGSDVTNMLNRQNIHPEKNQKTKENQKTHPDEYPGMEIYKIEFQHFLDRCTAMLNLPTAARRLFTEKGMELFLLKDLERDQLIYVSCGEPWIDPHLTVAQHKKRVLLNNLASDISAIRAYCIMRNPEILVLAVRSNIAAGARLFVDRCIVASEEEKLTEELQENQTDGIFLNIEDHSDLDLNSHAKSHLKADAWHMKSQYSWQKSSYDFAEDDSFLKDKDKEFFENAEFFQKYRPQPKLSAKLQKAHHQQFEFRDKQIVNCAFPGLVLGVQDADLHAGTEVILVEKKPDNTNQRWIWRDYDRTFHLMSDPNLVLAVSMPSMQTGYSKSALDIQGCAAVLQKYKEYSNGAANQKWHYIEKAGVFSAFYSTVLDQEITAANHTSVCTFSVTGREKIDQPGYCFLSPSGKQKFMICLACARAIRGKKELKKLPAGSMFFCASGSEEASRFSLGPFKCVNVMKTDLSTLEAENTLSYLEKVLASLRTETSIQTISEKISAAMNQKTVKIIAYRNGAGYQNGQLIIASTFLMLLTMCTRQFELTRKACRLYTNDGTLILTLPDLVTWAVNDCFRQSDSAGDYKEIIAITDSAEGMAPLHVEDKHKEEEKVKSALSLMTPDSLHMIDDSLLTIILRNPIEVWVSCGEPFLPLDALQKAARQGKQNWLEKDKILADLDAMKHKMRQLQGRRITAFKPAALVPTKSPVQPVVVEGGWTEETQEEMKLMENIQHTETHFSEVQASQFKRSSPFSPKLLLSNHRCLYDQPSAKRVWAYRNGYKSEQGVYVWGKTVSELLDNCTTRLNMQQPATALYTPDGDLLQSWDEIERDMVLCVSAGKTFLSRKAIKQQVEVRAIYARIRKQQGPDATDIVVSPSEKLKGQVRNPSSLLALTTGAHYHLNNQNGGIASAVSKQMTPEEQ